MTISELNAGQGNVNVEGTISEMGEVKSFNKFGKELKVANAILQDDSGTIKLTLWNDDVTKFKEGDKVKIENGYVNEFQGEKQLTAGKFGKMELAGGDSGQAELPGSDTDVPEGAEEAMESAVDGESEDVAVDETEVETAESTPDEIPVEELEGSESEDSESGTENQEEAVI